VEEHVVTAGCGNFTSPLGLNLANDICQVETTASVPNCRLTDHLDGLNRRHRDAPQKSDQLGD
jgi:hypothetical protein